MALGIDEFSDTITNGLNAWPSNEYWRTPRVDKKVIGRCWKVAEWFIHNWQ